MPGATQLSYSHGTSSCALLGETIGENLRRVAAAHPDSEAVVEMATGRRWTYAQLDTDCDTIALGLLEAGIKTGDRVGIWAPNCAEWVLLQYATARIGAILVNINPAYRSYELGYVLRQSGIRLLVSAESFKSSNYRAMIGEVSGDLDALERVIYLGTAQWQQLLADGAAARRRRRAPTGCRNGRRAWPSTTRSTSSTPAGRRASRRARRSPITTSSTTASSSASCAGTRPMTGSASRCRSTTASAWCSATWPAPRMPPAS